jgi:hypothetical protein
LILSYNTINIATFKRPSLRPFITPFMTTVFLDKEDAFRWKLALNGATRRCSRWPPSSSAVSLLDDADLESVGGGWPNMILVRTTKDDSGALGWFAIITHHIIRAGFSSTSDGDGTLGYDGALLRHPMPSLLIRSPQQWNPTPEAPQDRKPYPQLWTHHPASHHPPPWVRGFRRIMGPLFRCHGRFQGAGCRMDLPGPTTSVGTRTDYSVGLWDYPACATRHLKAWSTRTTQE